MKIAKFIGAQLSNAALIAAGYIWATHGVIYAAALLIGVLVVALAVVGAVSLTDRRPA